jgi:hypothetical protein
MQQVLNYYAIFPSAIVQPTGPHDVGRLRARLRIAGAVGRYLTIQLWYPTEGAPTVGDRLLTLYSRLRHPTWAPARYRAQLPSAQSVFPLITYVPDAPGGRQDNTYTLANLASHGFILAALQNPFVNDSTQRQHALVSNGNETVMSFADHQIRSGVIAASELLDALDQLNSKSAVGTWAGRFDLKRAGILGYALGGTVAAATSAVDGRYVVAGSLDGPGADGPLVKVPYLLMRSDSAAKNADRDSCGDRDSEAKQTSSRPSGNGARMQASLPTSHIFEIVGARREHFSDRLVTTVRFARGARRSVGLRVRAIIDAYTVAFFKTYLGSSPHPLMCVRHSPYPEVRFVEGNEPGLAASDNVGKPVARSETH